MSVTVTLDDDLTRAAEAVARTRGRPLSEVVSELLRRALSAGEPAALRSLAAIEDALREEPLEDGVTHAAEAALAGHLKRFGAGEVIGLIRGTAPAQGAALLKLLGRTNEVPADDRAGVVAWALASPQLELRDAAIQAVETWNDRALAKLLEAHHEPVEWLAAYARDVVRDLAE